MKTLLFSVAGCIKCCHCGPEPLKIGDLVELDLNNAAIAGLPDKIRAEVISVLQKSVPIVVPSPTPGGPSTIQGRPGHEYGLEYDETLLLPSSLTELRQCDIVGIPRCLTCCDLIETHPPLTLTTNPGAAPSIDATSQVLNIPPPAVVHPAATMTYTSTPFAANVADQVFNIPAVTVQIDPSGAQSVTIGGVTHLLGVSADALNLLRNGADGRAFLDCEAVQDCIGQAIAGGAGITYDDAMNAIRTWLTGLTFNDSTSVDFTTSPGAPNMGVTATVRLDPAGGLQHSPQGIGVVIGPGVSADAGNILANGSDGKPMLALVDCNGSPLPQGAPVATCDLLHAPMLVTNSPTPFTFNGPNQTTNIPEVTAGAGLRSITIGGVTTNLGVSSDAGNTATIGADGLILVRQRPLVAAEYTWNANYSTLTLTATSPTAGVTFAWTDPAGGALGSGANLVVPGAGVPGYKGGRYTVTATDPVTALTSTEFVFVDPPAIAQKTLFVDAVYGDDTTARREYRDLPFITIAAAIAAAAAGDTVVVRGEMTLVDLDINKRIDVITESPMTITGGLLFNAASGSFVGPMANAGFVALLANDCRVEMGSVGPSATGYGILVTGARNTAIISGDVSSVPVAAIGACVKLVTGTAQDNLIEFRDAFMPGAYVNNDSVIHLSNAGRGNMVKFRDYVNAAGDVYLLRAGGVPAGRDVRRPNTIQFRTYHGGRGVSMVGALAVRLVGDMFRTENSGYGLHLDGNPAGSIAVTSQNTDDGTESSLWVDINAIEIGGNTPAFCARNRAQIILETPAVIKAPNATGAVFTKTDTIAGGVGPYQRTFVIAGGTVIDAPLAVAAMNQPFPHTQNIILTGNVFINALSASTGTAVVDLGSFILSPNAIYFPNP